MKFIYSLLAFFKKYFDRIHNDRMRLGLLQALPFWVASVLAGIVAVAYAALFKLSEELSIQMLKLGDWVIFILAPVCFVMAAFIVDAFASNARGSGIPQVMAAIELAGKKEQKRIDRLLSLKIVLVKVASSLLMVFGGGAVGREGPTIQIVGSIFHKVNNWTPANWPKVKKQNMIMTGAAAGLAAAFNTPLGGIVFAVEELTKTHMSYFRTALFSAVIIAGLTAQGILGPYLYIGYPNVEGLSPYIVGGVLIVAIISGLSGGVFSKLILRLMSMKASLSKPWKKIAWTILCGVVLAALAFFVNRQVLGSGKEVMTPLLFSDHKTVDWTVPFLRIVGPAISFVAGGAGGIFAPSLSAGATIGASVAGWFSVTPSNANLLILAGMVGFLTGVTRTPFTAAILVLEMTDRHSVIFYLMLAGLIANLVALIIDRRSFYDHLKKQYLKDVLVDEHPLEEKHKGSG